MIMSDFSFNKPLAYFMGVIVILFSMFDKLSNHLFLVFLWFFSCAEAPHFHDVETYSRLQLVSTPYTGRRHAYCVRSDSRYSMLYNF